MCNVQLGQHQFSGASSERRLLYSGMQGCYTVHCMVGEESVKNRFFFKVREFLHELRVTMKLAVSLLHTCAIMNVFFWMYTQCKPGKKRHINIKYSECDRIDDRVGNCIFLSNFPVFVNLWQEVRLFSC